NGLVALGREESNLVDNFFAPTASDHQPAEDLLLRGLAGLSMDAGVTTGVDHGETNKGLLSLFSTAEDPSLFPELNPAAFATTAAAGRSETAHSRFAWGGESSNEY
ncbi:MAG: hypothetical protein MUD14_12715, partial [Hydrococcus sp. Prado102]|nr:hypothetical protein [Hydrococcus sp. Prado102]